MFTCPLRTQQFVAFVVTIKYVSVLAQNESKLEAVVQNSVKSRANESHYRCVLCFTTVNPYSLEQDVKVHLTLAVRNVCLCVCVSSCIIRCMIRFILDALWTAFSMPSYSVLTWKTPAIVKVKEKTNGTFDLKCYSKISFMHL